MITNVDAHYGSYPDNSACYGPAYVRLDPCIRINEDCASEMNADALSCIGLCHVVTWGGLLRESYWA
jgi:hypothetical protein